MHPSAHLGAQVVVENLQRGQLFVHPFRIVGLLLLDNVPSCFDYSLHFKLDFTQNFIEFLKNEARQILHISENVATGTISEHG